MAEVKIKKTHVYQLLEAAEVDENLSAIAEKSLLESQAREIASGARLFLNITPEVEAQVQVSVLSRATWFNRMMIISRDNENAPRCARVIARCCGERTAHESKI